MTSMPHARSRTSCVCLAALTLLALGCRESTAPLGSALTVQNTTGDTLGYALLDLQAPGPRDHTSTILGNFAAWGGRVISPAATESVAVDDLYGYAKRADLSVIVYSVARGMATYRGEFVVTRAQLEQRRYRIELTMANVGN